MEFYAILNKFSVFRGQFQINEVSLCKIEFSEDVLIFTQKQNQILHMLYEI